MAPVPYSKPQQLEDQLTGWRDHEISRISHAAPKYRTADYGRDVVGNGDWLQPKTTLYYNMLGDQTARVDGVVSNSYSLTEALNNKQ